MNLTLQKISFIFLSLLIISSCSTYNFEDQMPDELVEDVDKQEEVSIREIPFSDIMDDIQQGFMLNGYSNYRLENNQLNTAFGKLGNGMVKELKDYRFEIVRTAIPIIPDEFNPRTFYNLVITKPLKGQKAPEMVIVEYILENEEYNTDFDFSNYTGYIRTYSLNGEIINDIRMIDGKQATIANNRTENICGYEYEWKSATICPGPTNDYCNTQYYWDAIPIDCAGTPEIDGGGPGSSGGTPMNQPTYETHLEGSEYPTDVWFDYQFWQNYTPSGQFSLPSYSSFNNAYPRLNAHPVYDLIGGQIKAMKDQNPNSFLNACAARVSRALNYSGVSIPNLPGITFQGGDGKYYFLGASNLLNWMQKEFGSQAIEFTGSQGGQNGQNFPNLLSGYQGIYSLVPNYPEQFGASGHATGWDGNNCFDKCYFNPPGGINKIVLFPLN